MHWDQRDSSALQNLDFVGAAIAGARGTPLPRWIKEEMTLRELRKSRSRGLGDLTGQSRLTSPRSLLALCIF